ncbi:phosphotransferase enzyme family protein [Sclerotinia borealis F-4128]|uniref:Phosphotransferase enzyme family protein n=1 Tax=Sclerotinia borealis (strain F-4128) TaxID=1432307 RepID=W9CU69_SCLBF|nr:phosphotransferase enzyme family protein [Sclerotinia borealis F-4128]
MLSSDGSMASTNSIDSDDLNSQRSTNENNPLLPTTEKVQEIFARSRHIWQGYLERAKSMHRISPESLKLSSLLHRLPALPDDLDGVTILQGQYEASATVRILPAPDVEREQELVQRHMPEPCGEFSIILPLAPQVQTLFGLYSLDTSNGFQDSVSVFCRLLKHGKVLHQVLSKWIVKITASIVVKFAPGLNISEYQTICHVWSHRGTIPIPEPLGAVSIGSCNYIFMSYIEGDPLANHWPHLSPELKSSVRSQLGEILRCLRRMPLQSKYLGSGDPPLCRDLRRHVRTSVGRISTEMEFKTFLISTRRELNPVYCDLITSTLSTNHQIVMTHSDIRPENILVLYTAPNAIRITGLVDWELSGAYPEYWEYVKALAGVTWSLSNWCSYLPTDIIGSHIDAWRQECLIDRLVL